MTQQHKQNLFLNAVAQVQNNWDPQNDCPKGMAPLSNKEMTDHTTTIHFVTHYKQQQRPALIAALKQLLANNQPLDKQQAIQIAKKIYLQQNPQLSQTPTEQQD